MSPTLFGIEPAVNRHEVLEEAYVKPFDKNINDADDDSFEE